MPAAPSRTLPLSKQALMSDDDGDAVRGAGRPWQGSTFDWGFRVR